MKPSRQTPISLALLPTKVAHVHKFLFVWIRIFGRHIQSELGKTWTKHCRTQVIGTETTEPHNLWQNPGEIRIGYLSDMVRNVMQEFGVPLSRHHWAQKWCCDVHNIVANRKWDWRSAKEQTGHTPDISMFRFHLWEPIWYYEPGTKQTENSLKKARWLGSAHLAGDAMTYFIETEKETNSSRNMILVRSIIQTRRKNIGTKEEYVNDNPMLADFFLSDPELEINKDDEIFSEDTAQELPLEPENHDKPTSVDSTTTAGLRESDDLPEALPPGEADNDPPMSQYEMEKMYDQYEMEEDVNYKFDRILDHEFKDGVLLLKTRYCDDDIGEHDLTVPFPILKRDVPLELARFIRDKVVEDKRGGHYNLWAKSTLKAHARGIRRLYRSYNVDSMYRSYRTRRAKANRMPKNARNAQAANDNNKIKMGIKIPRNTKETLFFDKLNKNTLWADAIFKEMCGL
jgi:hypothetical protein